MKNAIKIGISIGTMRGQRMFETPIEHPIYAIKRANEIIHENFSPEFSLYFRDNSERRGSRRRT